VTESDHYDVRPCAISELSEEDLAACVRLVTDGDAVRPEYARRDLPRSLIVATARKAGEIVGVGTIKTVRPNYASGIAKKSGVDFAARTPELGYVAVHPDHRGKRLSHRLLEALLTGRNTMFFATTSSEPMKRALANAGFSQMGETWKGRRGDVLSLWIKES
jgi:predicted GNAT family N-acyltransferase